MTSAEVFRPSNGELLVRDNIAQGPAGEGCLDLSRPRPVSQSGYRFGQLSHNSFFTRHNPHPHRVKHFKGLLDVPICSVNDDGYFASPRYSLQFPPNSFNTLKLQQHKGRVPVNAMNIHSQLHPINTITGLQYFGGLQNYPWRERAVPRMGLVPVTEAWREELKRFTELLGDMPTNRNPDKDNLPKEDRPRTSTYSPDTGRLIPPPSRAMSRGQSRRGARAGQLNGFPLQHIAPQPDLESVVFTMLCQILQTEDVNAVQAWLCSAEDREKNLVMEMIHAAMGSREEYWKQYPPAELPLNDPKLPPINSRPHTSQVNGNIYRPPTGQVNGNTYRPPTGQVNGNIYRPPTGQVNGNTYRPPTGQINGNGPRSPTGQANSNGPKPPTGQVNRLVLEDKEPVKVPVAQCEAPKAPVRTVVEDKDIGVDAPTSQAFRPHSPPKKAAQQPTQRPSTLPPPSSPAVAPKPPPQQKEKPASDSEQRTKMEKSPAKEPANDDVLNMWNQNQSVNTF